MKNKISESACFITANLDKFDIQAIKALNEGNATPHQQRLALAVICNKFSRAQEMLYVPNSHDETAFLNGRAFVGQKILRIINVPIGTLTNEIEEAETDEHLSKK